MVWWTRGEAEVRQEKKERKEPRGQVSNERCHGQPDELTCGMAFRVVKGETRCFKQIQAKTEQQECNATNTRKPEVLTALNFVWI